jgi:lipopolysaccharide/colanic/teichoic acid biosynthesis glycosyltransferase
MVNEIVKKFGKEVFAYLNVFCDTQSKKTLILSSSNPFNISQLIDQHNALINLSKINNIRYINKYFINVNSKLEIGDIYIGCGETFTYRKNRKKINNVPIIGSLYFLCEFIFLRVFPKIWGFKKIYFFITRGRNRLLSKGEILGRLVSCGFEIIDYKTINGLMYFVIKKVKDPISTSVKPSYGPLYKMPRMGKNGKTIGVYKFRTMHPYAEFLHDYILKTNGYSNSGKPANDFRLTPWGKFLRRYWLDELPQLINVLKGELKLVGVRPISTRYFQDIPKDLQILRIKHKPGCIPPYIAFNKASSVSSVLAAEKEYLIRKEKNPYFTDMFCFFSAIWNIVINKKRSA